MSDKRAGRGSDEDAAVIGRVIRDEAGKRAGAVRGRVVPDRSESDMRRLGRVLSDTAEAGGRAVGRVVREEPEDAA